MPDQQRRNWFITSRGEPINLDFVTKILMMDQPVGGTEKSLVIFHGVATQPGGSIKYKFPTWEQLHAEYLRMFNALIDNGLAERPDFAEPTLDPVAPLDVTSGGTFGGENIIITGTGFLKGSYVKFGTEYAFGIRVMDNEHIHCQAPAAAGGTPGVVDVTVIDFLGRFVIAEGGYEYV